MELMIIPVPLFNRDLGVEAYWFHYSKGNDLLGTSQTSAALDGATVSPALEVLADVGIDAITTGQPVVVPLNKMMLLSGAEKRGNLPSEKIIFLLEADVPPTEETHARLREMTEKGFRIAFRDLINFEAWRPFLYLGSYLFLSQQGPAVMAMTSQLAELQQNYRHLMPVAVRVDRKQQFIRAASMGFRWFEGSFYRLPVTKGQTSVSPLKTNLLRLINLAQDTNFEFSEVSEIVERDPALSLSLMRMVNLPFAGKASKIKALSQAVVILGQDEVRKWIATSVSRFLGADKPNEITKLSLVRAKMAENLAELFGLQNDARGLFLMGLFSVLDAVLEMPMQEALKLVMVSDEIYDALVSDTGPYAVVLRLLLSYEEADWPVVSRELILHDISVKQLYAAYINAISWYGRLVREDMEPEQEAEIAETVEQA